MSDEDFVDTGDELIVSIAGYPVGKAEIVNVGDSVEVKVTDGNLSLFYRLPLDFGSYNRVDGYGHGSQPLEGVETPEATRTLRYTVEDTGGNSDSAG